MHIEIKITNIMPYIVVKSVFVNIAYMLSPTTIAK